MSGGNAAGGYAGRILYVDLSTGTIDKKPLPEEVTRRFLGGKGLAAYMLYNEIPPGTDPLGPENVLMFATGPMTGSPLAGGVKYTVACRSPLTGTWDDSSASGFWGPQLKFAGYDALLVRGKSPKPVFLWITGDTVELRPADRIWGLNAHETDAAVKALVGDDRTSVAVIGPSGEKLVLYATITNDQWRHAARGGTGAVMGSKNLKAVAVRARGKAAIADPPALRELRTDLHARLKNQVNRWGLKHNLMEEGTNEFLDIEIKTGVTPWRNYQTVRQIPMQEALRKHYVKSRVCPGCVQTCWIVRGVKSGPYSGVEGVGPEYESLSCLGPVCDVTDVPTILKANLLCNLYGIDTISTGASVAFAMECYENGILSRDDLEGLDLRFGNGEALVKMIEMIGERRGIGRLLGEGVLRASREIGQGSERYAVHTKGLEYPGYMPKLFPAMSLALATADRGACHLRAWISEEVFTHSLKAGETDLKELKRRAELVATTQNRMAWLNSTGLCTHDAYFYYYPELPRVLKAATGVERSEEDLQKIGERIYTLTRLFNSREGFERKDDNLPWRFLHEPVPDGPYQGAFISPEHFELMLDHYYLARGWDQRTGIPTEATLKALGLPAV
jgi:aldehyde:ferredoxin oxidoreductase